MVFPPARRVEAIAVPHMAPEAARAMRAPAWRRLGMEGNLSATSSPTAKTEKMLAVVDDRMKRNWERRSGIRLWRAAWLATAGGVKVRNPASAPMPDAR